MLWKAVQVVVGAFHAIEGGFLVDLNNDSLKPWTCFAQCSWDDRGAIHVIVKVIVKRFLSSAPSNAWVGGQNCVMEGRKNLDKLWIWQGEERNPQLVFWAARANIKETASAQACLACCRRGASWGGSWRTKFCLTSTWVVGVLWGFFPSMGAGGWRSKAFAAVHISCCGAYNSANFIFCLLSNVMSEILFILNHCEANVSTLLGKRLL